MKLDEYLRFSSLPEMEKGSIYLNPKIPKNKLENAIRSYAPGAVMSNVVVLMDETFWGSADEGMLITNEKIYLSKNLGGSTIDLFKVNEIKIKEKTLIINNSPITTFNYAALNPLNYLGNLLNRFLIASRNFKKPHSGITAFDQIRKERLRSFLSSISEPIFFDSVTLDVQEKSFSKTPSFDLAENITEDKKKFAKFQGQFTQGEELLCVSWLGRSEFFCVSTYGVRSIMSDQAVFFISHEDLRNLDTVEEYEQSRYVGLRLSNGDGVIVSVQNSLVRPYALELFKGLIKILRGQEPDRRSPPTERQSIKTPNLKQSKYGDLTAHVLQTAYEVMENKLMDAADAKGRKFWKIALSGCSDVYKITTSMETRRKLWPTGSPPIEEALSTHMILFACVYTNAMQSLPENFKSEMDSVWFSFIALPEMIRDEVEATCNKENIPFNFGMEIMMLFQIFTSSLANDSGLVDTERLMADMGAKDSSDLAVILLEKIEINPRLSRELMEKSSNIINSWHRGLLIKAAAAQF